MTTKRELQYDPSGKKLCHLQRKLVSGDVKIMEFHSEDKDVVFWRLQSDDRAFDVTLSEVTKLTEPWHILQDGLEKLIANFDKEYKARSKDATPPVDVVIDAKLLTTMMSA